VRWDSRSLSHGPAARREEAPPADAGEALWLTYYASIFNPARLKLDMMRKEMPRRYWHNLPESVLIQPLAQAAAARSGGMVEQEPVVPVRRMPRIAPPVAPAADPAAPAGLRIEPASCATLEALSGAMQSCRACPIGACATQAVPGEGPAGARLMFVGEQPGDQEDLRGRPFVGPAGALFDRALQQLGIPRDTIYVTNAVKHFKYELRGKRRIHKTPAQQEAAACLEWLEREIELVRPQAVVALGATAARALMGRAVAVMRERGHWLRRPADGLPVLVTLHPSALLRMEPEPREAAWHDWLNDLARATTPR
jgi:DNA polymerase